jgi:LAO/AO transport system kinase
MERLSHAPNAFIRPSPTGGTLGGATRKTRESIIVCEAAGYNIVLVETVGVGQSETAVKSMTDCFVLLALAGAGDELQAIKKGIVELADLIVITKADGDNRERALVAAAEYSRALRYLAHDSQWPARVQTCSAQTGIGLPELWETIKQFHQIGQAQGWFDSRRKEQTREWLHTLIQSELERRFYQDIEVASQLPIIEQAVLDGNMTVVEAATRLLDSISK